MLERRNLGGLMWGLILILAGAYFMAENLGIFEVPGEYWKFIFAGAAVLFFITYLINGVEQWGWLFPATVFAGVSTTMFLGDAGITSGWIAMPILLSVAIPFVVGVLIGKAHKAVLIPAYVMLIVSLIPGLAEGMQGELFVFLFMTALAIPFLATFLLNRKYWWALIPGFVLLATGLIPMMATTMREEYIGTFVTGMVALPFLVTYFWSSKNWWALIPAGILLSVAITVAVMAGSNFELGVISRGNGMIFLGTGITFGLLWLRRATAPTGWAIYPAAGFGLFGLAALIFGIDSDLFWPVALIAGGALILFLSLMPRRTIEN